MPKLIIIRGPSGAGKSSVARAIKDRSDRPTLLIEQDMFRPLFNRRGTDSNIPIWELLEANIKVGLSHGQDVILEGILNVQKRGRLEFFERLFNGHPGENYIFYLDVSFEESLNRHKTRKVKYNQFGEKEMKDWWNLASKMGHTEEIIIPEDYSAEETLAKIAKTCGLKLLKQS